MRHLPGTRIDGEAGGSQSPQSCPGKSALARRRLPATGPQRCRRAERSRGVEAQVEGFTAYPGGQVFKPLNLAR
jgi:hypothetical protein